jgi:hypothetical protein
MPTLTLRTLSFVVFVVATSLPWLMSVQAQQPQAQGPAAASPVDLTGRWRFTSFGSVWAVDLKLDPSKTTDAVKLYCGEAERERRILDSPIIKARLCAVMEPRSGQLLVEVQSVACRAPWRSSGTLEGTCSGTGMAGTRMDPAMTDSMAPMGGFNAIRLAAGAAGAKK